MTTQTELPIYKIITDGRRGMRMQSLRPGMYVQPIEAKQAVCVIQNSAKLGKVEVRWPDGFTAILWHRELDLAIYQGQGAKRPWWPFLPRFLRRWVCPYGPPVKKQR